MQIPKFLILPSFAFHGNIPDSMSYYDSEFQHATAPIHLMVNTVFKEIMLSY